MTNAPLAKALTTATPPATTAKPTPIPKGNTNFKCKTSDHKTRRSRINYASHWLIPDKTDPSTEHTAAHTA